MIVRVLLVDPGNRIRPLFGPQYSIVTESEYDVRVEVVGTQVRIGSTRLDVECLDAEKLHLAVQLALVLDASGDLIYITAEDGRLLYANRAWRAALAETERVVDVVVPEFRAAFQRSLDRALAGERVDIDSVFAGRDGRRIVVAGYLVGTHGGFRDVTEQRRAEDAQRRLVATLEATVDLVAIYTMAGDVVYLNHAARRILGKSPNVPQHMWDIAVPVALKEGHWAGETSVRDAEGIDIPVSQVLVAHPSTQGGVWFLSTIMRDLSEWKKLDRMKNEFVSTVSHELRTPLTSIRGALGLLEAGVTGVLSDKGVDLVHVARENCERLIRLINDMLDLDKIEAGVLSLDLTDLAPTDIVNATLDGIAGMAVVYGIRLERNITTDATIRADRDRIVQVLTNLISNAIKFSPTRSAVRVTVEERDQRLRFCVENSGQGIPAADRDKLFRRFQQLDGADNRARGGTGLGLAIAKAIVEQHDGQIGFESEPNVRTTFWFDLPLLQARAR